MALRSLLVHIDDSDRCSHRLGIACRIAHEFAAQLVGVYLVPTPQLSPMVAALLPDDVVEKQLQATGAAQDLAEARFSDAAQRASLVTIEWRAPAGDPVEALAAHARSVDLTVIGQPDPRVADAHFDNRLADAIVLSTGRPALVVPYNGVAGAVGRTILVAWDDSKEAARAVADALPLLAKAKRVIVVAIRTSDEDEDTHTTSHVDAYLRRHSVIAAIRQVDKPQDDIGELLLAQAKDIGADLMVMGGYGHTPLRELVLGGPTHSVLMKTPIAVLMSH